MVTLFKKQKSEKEIIEEIHNEFDTAPDRLLQEALNIIEAQTNSKVVLESGIEDKAKRLEKLGFIKNGLVARKGEIAERNKKKEEVIKLTSKQAETIKYYKDNYPFVKTLTVDELDRICDKYGLIYAPVQNYKMPVPDKNLVEIENSQKLNYKDVEINKFYVNYKIYDWSGMYALEYVTPKDAKSWDNPIFIESSNNDLTEWEVRRFVDNKFNNTGKTLHFTGNLKVNKIKMDGLFIAAPKKHFDLTGLEHDKKKGYFTIAKTVVQSDPIVFRYVRGGMVQVLTKWGLEANDPALAVEILN